MSKYRVVGLEDFKAMGALNEYIEKNICWDGPQLPDSDELQEAMQGLPEPVGYAERNHQIYERHLKPDIKIQKRIVHIGRIQLYKTIEVVPIVQWITA